MKIFVGLMFGKDICYVGGYVFILYCDIWLIEYGLDDECCYCWVGFWCLVVVGILCGVQE